MILLVSFSQKSGRSVLGLFPGPGKGAFEPPFDSPSTRDFMSRYAYMVNALFWGKPPVSADGP
jgi:hypothetical protein